MRATGIIRRMDDLGRIVIPKEIRRSMGMNPNDPIEIFTDKNTLVLKKYTNFFTDWFELGEILTKTVCDNVQFALYDEKFQKQYSNSDLFYFDGSKIESDFIRTIIIEDEVQGYIAFNVDEFAESSNAVQLAKAIIETKTERV